jgi:glutamyl-tRNA synthetase
VPLIHGSDGAKLSKRHGALGVHDYRDMGILPEALFNYLLRLGWGHGDQEEFTQAEAIALFDLDGVGKSPSRFDLKKLQNLNGHYIRLADDARLAELVAARIGPGAEVALLTSAMPVLKTRARDLDELASGAAFLFKQRPLALTEQAQALLDADGKALLARLAARLRDEQDWTTAALEANLKAYAEDQGLGLGKLAQPLARGVDGADNLAGNFRCAGPPRPGGKPRADRRAGCRLTGSRRHIFGGQAGKADGRRRTTTCRCSTAPPGPTSSTSASSTPTPGCSPTIPGSPRPRAAKAR